MSTDQAFPMTAEMDLSVTGPDMPDPIQGSRILKG
jgi:hypothetical protein